MIEVILSYSITPQDSTEAVKDTLTWRGDASSRTEAFEWAVSDLCLAYQSSGKYDWANIELNDITITEVSACSDCYGKGYKMNAYGETCTCPTCNGRRFVPIFDRS